MDRRQFPVARPRGLMGESPTLGMRVRTVSLLLLPLLVPSPPVACEQATDAAQVARALHRIRRSVDPCGESAEVVAVLDRFQRCPGARYRICTSTEAPRNLFERPTDLGGEQQPATITWNPSLRSELEQGCDGDPTTPVMRDPTASLLHEIVHAVHDCAGRNPGEYELDAVRIENIYRRAVGLCERPGYGDDPLPPGTLKTCRQGRCACVRAATASHRGPATRARSGPVADAAWPPSGIPADPAR